VAQRNVSVVATGAAVSNLVTSLNKSRLLGTRLQLIQVGPKEGELVRSLATPKLRVAQVDTHVLGEINVAGEIVRTQPDHVATGMLAPVHALAAGGAPAQHVVRAPGAVRVIDPRVVLRDIQPAQPAPTNNVADLMAAIGRLNQGAGVHPPPTREEAQVLRLASYSGQQLVGGYTLVVTGGG
jgi:hypothetical protein